MYSIRTKLLSLSLAGALLLLSVFLSACSRQPRDMKTNLKLKNAEYAVVLSRTYEYDAELLLIDHDGKIFDTLHYGESGVSSANYYQGDLYVYSGRNVENFVLRDSGELQMFSMQTDKIDHGECSVSWFTANGQDGLIEALNIGIFDGHYYSGVRYTDGSQKKEAQIDDFMLCSAVEYDGKIFVNTSHNTDAAWHPICVIDKESGKYDLVSFEHGNTPAQGRLVLLNGKVFTYGDNLSYMEAMDETEVRCTLGMLDAETFETKEVDFTDDMICLMYAFEDYIYVITESGTMYVFDDDLELTDKKPLADSTFKKNYLAEELLYDDKFTDRDDKIAVLYINAALDPQNVGFIQEYSKRDMTPIRRIDITPPDPGIWMGQQIAVAAIE